MEMDLSKVTVDIFTKLEQKWLSHCDTTRKTRILSIDGGGTTGIVAAASLLHLEHQIRLHTGDPHAHISDFFDIVAGTGIGGILASLLVAADGSGRPMFTARDAVKFLTEKNSELFEVRYTGVFKRNKRYSGKSMEKVLEKAFRREDGKVLTMKDTCKPLLVPCYDLKSSAPFVFSRAGASESPSFDFELWKVCRATSATPRLFKPFNVVSVDGKTSCTAVDGGLVMNNPTAAAVTHVLHNKGDFPTVNGVDDLVVLSLGNGSSSSRGRKLRRGTTSSVVDIVLDGVSDTVDQMMGNAFCWNRTEYVRIQANGLTSGGEEKVAAELLKERGVETPPFGVKRLLTETNGQRIQAFVQRLVASAKSSSLPLVLASTLPLTLSLTAVKTLLQS